MASSIFDRMLVELLDCSESDRRTLGTDLAGVLEAGGCRFFAVTAHVDDVEHPSQTFFFGVAQYENSYAALQRAEAALPACRCPREAAGARLHRRKYSMSETYAMSVGVFRELVEKPARCSFDEVILATGECIDRIAEEAASAGRCFHTMLRTASHGGYWDRITHVRSVYEWMGWEQPTAQVMRDFGTMVVDSQARDSGLIASTTWWSNYGDWWMHREWLVTALQTCKERASDDVATWGRAWELASEGAIRVIRAAGTWHDHVLVYCRRHGWVSMPVGRSHHRSTSLKRPREEDDAENEIVADAAEKTNSEPTDRCKWLARLEIPAHEVDIVGLHDPVGTVTSTPFHCYSSVGEPQCGSSASTLLGLRSRELGLRCILRKLPTPRMTRDFDR